jgi:hypothetical protein
MRRSIVSVAVLIAGCGGSPEPEGAGPPEILQVLARERVEGEEGIELAPRLVAGDHEDIGEEDDREVTEAVAWDGQRIRVVFDELLRGNHLEEIPCADGSWTQVPLGMDFDDVARCAGADLSRCEGLCLEQGGILDENGDGGFDDTRLIADAVVLTCDGEVIALDVQKSYYQPSGNQQMSSAGVESLGPAVVIAPGAGMPPGSTCGFSFAGSVVDKQDEGVGSTADITFTVEPFQVAGGEMPEILLNAELDAATIPGAVKITAGGVEVDDPIVELGEHLGTLVVGVPDGFVSGTEYVVTVTGGEQGLKDVHGDSLAADATITWSAP